MRANRISICISAIIIAASTAVFASESRNLTESNRRVLADKVVELQHMELMRLNRGRLKANPVVFPLHTVYQTVIQNQNLLISELTGSFAVSLARLNRIFEEHNAITYSTDGHAVETYFREELVRNYDLEKPLADSKSILEVSQAIDRSRYAMEALPVRAALALNALKWLSGDIDVRQPVSDAPLIDAVMRKWEPASDVFQMDESVRRLSAEYSKLCLTLAREKQSRQ